MFGILKFPLYFTLNKLKWYWRFSRISFAITLIVNSPAVRLRYGYFCEMFSLARGWAVVTHKICKITTRCIL